MNIYLVQNDSTQKLPSINTKFKIESSENEDYNEIKTPLSISKRCDRISLRAQSIDHSSLVSSRKMLKPIHTDISTNISSKLILRQNLRTLNNQKLDDCDDCDLSTVNLRNNCQVLNKSNCSPVQPSIEVEELQTFIKSHMLNYPDPSVLDPLDYTIQCIENNFDTMK